MTGRLVRERIDPRLTAALFANYRTPIDALLELVDNAVDSRIAERPLEVDLALRPGTISLTVVGGTGMGPRELEREYLRWGGSTKRAGERIGRFGQGGKAAIGHLGARFAITASPAGDARAYGFVDEAYRDRSRLRTYELRERAKPVPTDLGYVRIEIGEVDRKLDPRRVRVAGRRRLPAVPCVGRPRPAHRPGGRDPDRLARRRAPRLHACGLAGGLVRGWYGLLVDPPPAAIEAGLRLYHLGRLVGAPEWFGHPGPAVHPALNRLIGEVELPHVAVTLNKSDVERGDPGVAGGRGASASAAGSGHPSPHPGGGGGREPAGAAHGRAGPPHPGPGPAPPRVGQALRERRRLRGGQRGQGSADPGGLRIAGRDRGGRRRAEEEPASPRRVGRAGHPMGPTECLPRPSGLVGPDAVAGPASARSSSDALDPRLRSAMVVEEGVRRVVINSRYPLYEVRKGDLWYQLETALREVCVTIPEATVPEFERRVNELMVVSLGLAERRRRSRRKVNATSPALWTRR